MKYIRLLSLFLLLTGNFDSSTPPVWGAETGATKIVARDGNYCHMKFPAIREETLYWDRPVLKDKSDGDIIDYFGACNYDPLGREEVQAQKVRWQRDHDYHSAD